MVAAQANGKDMKKWVKRWQKQAESVSAEQSDEKRFLAEFGGGI